MQTERRILIVDDDDAIRTLLIAVLRRRGYEVDTARNGVEALERLILVRYALILLDLMMPHMNGYEVLERMVSEPIDPPPLVLVLTAGLEPKPLCAPSVIGTIHKPFDVSLLVDTIAGCLSTLDPKSTPLADAAAVRPWHVS